MADARPISPVCSAVAWLGARPLLWNTSKACSGDVFQGRRHCGDSCAGLAVGRVRGAHSRLRSRGWSVAAIPALPQVTPLSDIWRVLQNSDRSGQTPAGHDRETSTRLAPRLRRSRSDGVADDSTPDGFRFVGRWDQSGRCGEFYMADVSGKIVDDGGHWRFGERPVLFIAAQFCFRSGIDRPCATTQCVDCIRW